MEVCVDTIESALNAEKGGAIRIELCSSLAEGGLTPSVGFLKTVKRLLGIPVFVMIRCRGGDFIYSDTEIQIMLEDIRHLRANGADGFVLGVLNENKDVDYNKCKMLVDACGSFPVTFHRAFDEVVNPKENFQTIVNLGCSRLLTSGCKPTASDGVDLIRELVNENQIVVMPGSGITTENVAAILRGTGAKEFHGSAKMKVERNGHVHSVTDPELVVQMMEIYKIVVYCCSRLLTSGCELTAAEGASLIKELMDESKMTVMPGSGITVDNVGMVLKRTGAKEFHGSAKVKVERNGHVRSVTDANLVVEMTEIYKKIVFCKQCSSCDCEHDVCSIEEGKRTIQPISLLSPRETI